MLHAQHLSRHLAVTASIVCILNALPVGAQNSTESVQSAIDTGKAKQIVATATSMQGDKCPCCGCQCSHTSDGKVKHKHVSLLTDSLWGNLILEMAYERDAKLAKIAKKMSLLNLGTMGAIAGIAGGTLGQGISALQVLNPTDGHEDSYTPGIIGVCLSSATILTFAARSVVGHELVKDAKDRQLAIKRQVEDILHHLEYSQVSCIDAKKQLSDLIGERACHEWIQLWQSSHQLASTNQPKNPRVTTIPPYVSMKDRARIHDDAQVIEMAQSQVQDLGLGVP